MQHVRVGEDEIALIAKLAANFTVSGDVVVGYTGTPDKKWIATLTVRAVDADGLPVSGQTVAGSFSVNGQTGDLLTCVSCTTGSDGLARIVITEAASRKRCPPVRRGRTWQACGTK